MVKNYGMYIAASIHRIMIISDRDETMSALACSKISETDCALRTWNKNEQDGWCDKISSAQYTAYNSTQVAEHGKKTFERELEWR